MAQKKVEVKEDKDYKKDLQEIKILLATMIRDMDILARKAKYELGGIE
jgi:hypothetical protein